MFSSSIWKLESKLGIIWNRNLTIKTGYCLAGPGKGLVKAYFINFKSSLLLECQTQDNILQNTNGVPMTVHSAGV